MKKKDKSPEMRVDDKISPSATSMRFYRSSTSPTENSLPASLVMNRAYLARDSSIDVVPPTRVLLESRTWYLDMFDDSCVRITIHLFSKLLFTCSRAPGIRAHQYIEYQEAHQRTGSHKALSVIAPKIEKASPFMTEKLGTTWALGSHGCQR